MFPRPDRDPAPARDPAPTPALAEQRLGILVLGYNRPGHLQSVLESLRLQDALATVHVWIDGTQDRGEYAGASRETIEVARRYAVAERRAMAGHLGIEKMMLDALAKMSAAYDRVLVLEDDCFPLKGAVAAIEAALAEVADEPGIFSVYGHHFGVEPPEDPDFPRFQGWGWAAHSARIREILPEVRRLFGLSEAEYLAEVAAGLTESVRRRLDVTGPRDILTVLGRYFSWDSAIAYLTAARGLRHRRTAARAVINTGISAGIGHFHADEPFLRAPPFGMIPLAEAWDHWDRRAEPCLIKTATGSVCWT